LKRTWLTACHRLSVINIPGGFEQGMTQMKTKYDKSMNRSSVITLKFPYIRFNSFIRV